MHKQIAFSNMDSIYTAVPKYEVLQKFSLLAPLYAEET